MYTAQTRHKGSTALLPPSFPSGPNRCQGVSICMLPDEVLLEIFAISVDEDYFEEYMMRAWQPLVHVCHRWRNIVFGSPRRLNLRLDCTGKTRVRDTLDVWPALPLVICAAVSETNVDDIVAVLEHADRVKDIDLKFLKRLPFKLEKVLAAMEGPFPELTDLQLWWSGARPVPVLSNSFLGGSAPHLQSFALYNFPLPGLPKLLLSATRLVDLQLCIPCSRYLLPWEFATSLSALTSLESLHLSFLPLYFGSRPYQAPSTTAHSALPVLTSPVTRSVIPALTSFEFTGASNFLDNLMARFDAPRLNNFNIYIFWKSAFDTPHLAQFISRTPRLKGLEKARVSFEDSTAMIDFSSRTSGHGKLNVKILFTDSDLQVSTLRQVCISCLPPLSALQDLYIVEVPDPGVWEGDAETWLGLLRLFTAAKSLYLSEQAAPSINSALQQLVEVKTIEVMPVLQNIFLKQFQPSGSTQEGFGRFAAARQVTSHPIAVTQWERNAGGAF